MILQVGWTHLEMNSNVGEVENIMENISLVFASLRGPPAGGYAGLALRHAAPLPGSATALFGFP